MVTLIITPLITTHEPPSTPTPYWASEYHTLIPFSLKEPWWNKSVYFFLPGYLKAQYKSLYPKTLNP